MFLFECMFHCRLCVDRSSFTEYALKHGRDERFKAIEKARERELYFNEYIVEVRKKEKEDKEKKRDQVSWDRCANGREILINVVMLRWSKLLEWKLNYLHFETAPTLCMLFYRKNVRTVLDEI